MNGSFSSNLFSTALFFLGQDGKKQEKERKKERKKRVEFISLDDK